MKTNAEFKIKNYDITDFDQDMNLKIGANNILFFIYLLSPVFISIICSFLQGQAGKGILSLIYGDLNTMVIGLASTVPFILFGFCNLFLSSSSKPFVQAIFNKGQGIIILTAVLNLIVWAYVLAFSKGHASLPQFLLLLFSIFGLAYALLSKRLHDYFHGRSIAIKHAETS